MGDEHQKESVGEIKTDLDHFKFSEISPVEALITAIAARKPRNFVDPFIYTEPVDEGVTIEDTNKPVRIQPTIKKVPTFLLGNKRIQDEKSGDAGGIYKRPEITPNVFFVRANYVAPANSTMTHSELKGMGGKNLKQFYVTSGLGISYTNDFEVEIYNIQRPCKAALLADFTYDYYSKVLA